MRLCNAIALLAGIAVLGGCSVAGESAVHLESGNQATGYLTRPLMLTLSSDESVQNVAQRICDGVRPGADAKITFIGKVPGPDPVNIGDWGKYRYDCIGGVSSAKPAPGAAAAPTAAAPASGAIASAPVTAPAAAASAAAAPMAAVPAAPATAAAASGAALLSAEQQRACLKQMGTYDICLGGCLVGSASPVAQIKSECERQCVAQLPTGCN